MKRSCVLVLGILAGCGLWDKPRKASAPPAVVQPPPEPRRANPPASNPRPARTEAITRAPEAPDNTRPASRPHPQVASIAIKRADGVAAPRCLTTRRVDKGDGNNPEVLAKNACAFSIEVKAACMPSYAEPNDPYPGTYSLDSWLFTLAHREEQTERQSALCYQRGGKVLYATCQAGIPYFTAADGSKFACYR